MMKDLPGEIKIFGLGINLKFKLALKKWFFCKHLYLKAEFKHKNRLELIPFILYHDLNIVFFF